MKQDGWIVDGNGEWILRFRYDWESWDQNPKILIDKGMLQANAPPLLKSRTKMRRVAAIRLWRDLLSTGWRRIDPQWN